MREQSHLETASAGHDPQILKRVRIRPTDVIVNTAPKAGTTWATQLLHQLRTGGDETFESIYDVVPWLEFPGFPERSTEDRLATFEAQPDPRLFKAHLPHEYTPGTELARHVVVCRDPRDCAVSAYHHMRDMTDAFLAHLGGTRPAGFDSWFDRWVEGPWFDHLASWWPHRNDERVLFLRFAELKADLGAVIDRLAAFLGWDVPAGTRDEAERLSSFAWMKAQGDRFKRFTAAGPLAWQPEGFFRKGAVGDHRRALSGDQERRVLEAAAERWEPECLAYLELPQPRS